jgi:hypothetical protein
MLARVKTPFHLTGIFPPVTILIRGFCTPLKPNHQSDGLTTRIVVRVSRAPYIIFGVIFGGLSLLCFLVVGFYNDWSWFGAGVICLAAYGIHVLWFRSFEVKLDEDGVACASLFGKRVLRWDEIDRAEIRLWYKPKYEEDEPGQAFRPPFRLVVFSKPTSAKPPVRINIKLLSRTDIQKLVERLEASVAGCKVNVPSWMAPAACD